jgi:hypothetical protein
MTQALLLSPSYINIRQVLSPGFLRQEELMIQHSREKLSTSFRAALWAALIASAVGLLPRPGLAEDLFSLTKKLVAALPVKGSAADGVWAERFRLAAGLLENKKKELSQLDLSLAAGLNGDQAGGQSLYKLNLDASLSKSIYPSDLRFKAGTSVLYRNNVLQEDVTILVMNFDYYFKPWLETYAFVERFSDTYLSLKERYEVGGGLKLEFNVFDTPAGAKDRNEKAILEVDGAQSLRDYETYLTRLESSGPGEVDTGNLRLLLEDFKAERQKILAGLKQRNSLLSLGLALSVFSELEQAEINTTFMDDGVSVPLKYSPDSRQRFRVVLRPNVTFRPLGLLTFKGHMYLKYPLGGPSRIEGRLDYRRDSLFSAELKLPTDPEWGKKISLIIEFQQHYHNVPFRIPQSVVDDYLASGQVINATVAEKTHDIYAFKLSITF